MAARSGQQDGDDPRQEDPVERAGPADRGDGGAESLDLAQVEKVAADESTHAARDVGERRGRDARKRQGDGDVHVASEEREHEERRDVPPVDAELLVGVPQHADLEQADQEGEQEEEAEDEGQREREEVRARGTHWIRSWRDQRQVARRHGTPSASSSEACFTWSASSCGLLPNTYQYAEV